MVEQFLELLARARDSGTIEWIRWGQILSQIAKLTDISTEELNRRLKPKKPSRPKFAPPTAQPSPPMDERGSGQDGSSDAQPDSVPEAPRRPKKTGPLNARERAERDILAVLLNEPHRWDRIQHEVTLQQFSDEICRALAELYWQQQRDEGEVVFADFLAGLPDQDLAELAISLVEDAEMLVDADTRLKDAIAFFAEEKQRQEQSKHLADLRRSSGSEAAVTGEKPEASDPNDMLRKLQEKARRPDLRRTGS
jgi:hypothetical protein